MPRTHRPSSRVRPGRKNALLPREEPVFKTRARRHAPWGPTGEKLLGRFLMNLDRVAEGLDVLSLRQSGISMAELFFRTP